MFDSGFGELLIVCVLAVAAVIAWRFLLRH
jgi:hypothetical protein